LRHVKAPVDHGPTRLAALTRVGDMSKDIVDHGPTSPRSARRTK